MNKMLLTVGATLTAFAALAAEKLPTDYPANDIESGSVDGLTWTGAARAYKIENDVVLVFTNTTAGNCSFTLADGYQVDGRYLLVGGGGAGGSAHGALVGAGGGAGGFVEGNHKFDATTYSVTVGQGGAAKILDGWGKGDNGGDSCLASVNGSIALAKGGGAGGSGSGNQTNLSGANGGSGGGASKWQDGSVFGTVGLGTEGQGFSGGGVTDNGGYGGGGGGASKPGDNAVSAGDGVWHGGEGGDGKESDITGESLYYAGGGAGGSSEWYGGGSGQEKLVQGGLGGGGYSHISSAVEIATAGTDGLGGGGAGAVIRNNSGEGHWAGNGGNGVVVVRLTLPKPDVIKGLSFAGATEFFNIGEGDTMETVLVFKNTEKAGSFTLEGDADVRVLLVGGGGAGGNSGDVDMVGGGGGAGGFVEKDNVELGVGSYSVTVGKGGVPNGDKDYWSDSNPNNNGTDSFVRKNAEDVFRAVGGGAGGIPNGNYRTHLSEGKTGGSGGGGAVTFTWDYWYYGQIGGAGVDGQGCAGGKAYKNCFHNAGGGGGAGAAGDDAIADGKSGNGGDGLSSDITGVEVWYAGGGAGGAYSQWSHFSVSGGKGGGGGSTSSSDEGVAKAYSEDGTDGFGGGGAGCSCSYNDQYNPQRVGANAGRGGNGVVIVRVKKIYPNEPLPGVSFKGESEWYNLGHGKTRETVVIYTNVNEVGKLTLGRRATARVLLVGGGGAGGASDNFSNHVAVGGGGGAGGMVTNELAGTTLARGTYDIVVGKGGEPSSSVRTVSANGGDSYMTRDGQDVFRAKGGGAGANPVPDWGNPETYGVAGGSGGGGAVKVGYSRTGGEGTAGQGNNGGGSWNAGGGASYTGAGGGGGAGEKGQSAQAEEKSGVGGAGLSCDITGEDVWYAGGGAGGAYCYWSDARIAGGSGGGGMSVADTHDANAIVYYAEDGDDGFGGGGAGASAGWGDGGIRYTAKGGRGGNGIVIVRITEVMPVGMTVIIH